MGGRRLTQYNQADPKPVVALLEKRPLCFDATMWRLFVIDSWRSVLHEPDQRARLARGEPPDYCSDCTPGYRALMQSQGRCHPPANSTGLPAQQVVGGIRDRLDEAAAAAESTSARRGVADVKRDASRRGLQSPTPQGKPQGGCEPRPASPPAPAGLCAGGGDGT